MTFCGLDFGTSNTTLGHLINGEPVLVRLEGEAVTLPSAIFFPPSGGEAIGRAAIQAYLDGQAGRLMRGLKSALGRPLLDESTPVGRARLTFRQVIGRYVAAVKTRAEQAAGTSFEAVVLGRPVHFVDEDPSGDAAAEAALRDIATTAGFRDVSFGFEPIAASLDYERGLGREEVALIADIGGGTSDFTVVRLGPARRSRRDRSGDVLANDGIRVGGTDFDRLLSLRHVMPLFGFGSPAGHKGLDVPSAPFHDLSTWSTINRLYSREARRDVQEIRRDAARPDLVDRLLAVIEAERGHALLMDVEDAKVALAAEIGTQVDLGWIEPGLAARIGRPELVTATLALADRLAACAQSCIAQAGLVATDIDAVFLTGGSTRLAHARAAITAVAPAARIVEGDTFGSVGTGLAMEASRRYGPADFRLTA